MTFEAHLSRFTPKDWEAAVDTLAPEIHPIDLNATRVWLAFFPLELHLTLSAAGADERPALEHKLGLMGKWRLEDQIDSSHTFLYGHRYWPQIRKAVLAMAGESAYPSSLPEIITRVADHVSRISSVDRDQLIGIAIAGVMTLRQCGSAALSAASGAVQLPMSAHALSIRQLRSRRARNGTGWLGFLGGRRKRFRMTFNENVPGATFDVIGGQDIASGAQSDKRDYRSRDIRCIPGEGPIPVECRAASCGTCWIGVLAGADRLSPVDPREEGAPMKTFGYAQPKSASGAPLIRLACQTRPEGDVTFVIPPWNGRIGVRRAE